MQGVCSSDAECKSDERCTAGLCLKASGLQITTPANNSYANARVHVVATLSDPATPDSVVFSLGASGGNELGSATATRVSAGTYAADILPPPAAPSGPVVLSGVATFGARSIHAVPVSIALDRNAPEATSFAITTQPDYQDGGIGYYKAGAGSAVFSARVDGGPDPIDPASVQVSWANPSSGSPVAFDSSSQNAPPPYVFYVPRAAGGGLEGPQTFTLTVKNQAGNTATATAAVYFDDVPPRLPAQLALPLPGAWVARTAQDGGPAMHEVDLAVDDPGSGVQSVVAIPDGGIAVPLSVKSSGLYAAQVGFGAAPAMAAGPYAVQIVARDHLGNQSVQNYPVLVDDAPPSIDAGVDTRWYGVSGATTATPSVSISDLGSGVASAVISASGGGSSAAALDGGTPAAGTWSAVQPILLPTAPRDTPLPLAVQATDAVGNVTTNPAGITLNFDNVAPIVGTPSLITPPDGVVGGNPWFQGPSVNSSNIEIAAAIAEPNLDSSANNAPRINFTSYPGGVQTANSVPGTLQPDGRWHFVVPRLGGQNATGGGTPYTIVARDLAGNISANAPQVTLYFDDAAANSFKINVPVDTLWYSRNGSAGTQKISLGSSTGSVPVSGLRSIALSSGGATVGSCDLTSGNCSLDAGAAPAAKEAAYAFSVVATSNAGVTSTTAASRNVDDLAPVIDGSGTVPYPAADSGPLGWGHDGAHFTLRDSGTLFTFTAYDCGAGVGSSPAPFVGGSPSGVGVSVTASGTHACSNGSTATVYSYAVTLSSGFGGAPIGSYPAADNLVTVGLGLADRASGSANAGSTSKQVQVTRRLWLTNDATAPGYNSVALGPSEVVAGNSTAVVTLSRTSGALWSQLSSAKGQFAIGSNAGASPVAFISSGKVLNAVDLSSGSVLGTCALVTGAVLNGSFTLKSMLLLDSSDVLTSSTYQQITSCSTCADCTGAVTCTPSTQCGGACGGAVTQPISNRTRMNPTSGCADVSSSYPDFGNGVIGASGNLIYLASNTSLAAVPAAGGTPVTGSIAAASGFILGSGGPGVDAVFFTDSAGAGVERSDYAGGAFANKWRNPAGLAPLTQSPAGGGSLLATSASGFQAIAFGGASLGAALPGSTPASLAPWLDGAAVPLAYFPNVGGTGAIAVRTADPQSGVGGAAPFALPVLPAAIDSSVLGGDGTLFVASGGRVYAMVTDSTVPAPATAWSGPGKDACRSFNLQYNCPY